MRTLSKNKKMNQSPDYRLYEKMKKKAPKASRYWMVGDRLYHSGLFLTLFCIPAAFYIYTQADASGMWGWIIAPSFISITMVVTGIYCKRESYKLAIKAGIDINAIN
jgi:hypothetical protein